MTERIFPGARVPEGMVKAWTLTAYEVETPEGETTFVPFPKGEPVTPMVGFASPSPLIEAMVAAGGWR